MTQSRRSSSTKQTAKTGSMDPSEAPKVADVIAAPPSSGKTRRASANRANNENQKDTKIASDPSSHTKENHSSVDNETEHKGTLAPLKLVTNSAQNVRSSVPAKKGKMSYEIKISLPKPEPSANDLEVSEKVDLFSVAEGSGRKLDSAHDDKVVDGIRELNQFC